LLQTASSRRKPYDPATRPSASKLLGVPGSRLRSPSLWSLVLWLNQVTRWFCGEPPQTPRVDSGREPLPCTVSCPRLRLAFLATMRPALDPAGHRVPRVSLLVSPLLGGPARHRPFMPTLHLHQRKSSRNLHLQYSTKSQCTPCCQSLITARSDHPPILGRSGPQSPP
jgi:hypothetical protein